MGNGPLLTLQGLHCKISLIGSIEVTVQLTGRAARSLHPSGAN